jgi:hypothetical protein
MTMGPIGHRAVEGDDLGGAAEIPQWTNCGGRVSRLAGVPPTRADMLDGGRRRGSRWSGNSFSGPHRVTVVITRSDW